MEPCHVCGNVYDKSFKVVLNNVTFTFDSFECAIYSLAPVCNHCGCKIIGHGVEENEEIYCCQNCLRMHRGAFPAEPTA